MFDVRNLTTEQTRLGLERLLARELTHAVRHALEVIVSDQAGVPPFEALMKKFGIPGRVRVEAPRSTLSNPPENPDGWAIEPAELTNEIQRRWPGTVVTSTVPPHDYHAREWETATPRGACDAALTKDGEGLVLNGDIEVCAELALWFRGLVPSEVPLLFYDESFSANVPVGPNTTIEELVEPFRA